MEMTTKKAFEKVEEMERLVKNLSKLENWCESLDDNGESIADSCGMDSPLYSVLLLAASTIEEQKDKLYEKIMGTEIDI